jgi:hypothetical protein
VVPVLLTLAAAWFLALELVAVPFYRHGMDLKLRRQLSTLCALALGRRVLVAHETLQAWRSQSRTV